MTPLLACFYGCMLFHAGLGFRAFINLFMPSVLQGSDAEAALLKQLRKDSHHHLRWSCNAK